MTDTKITIAIDPSDDDVDLPERCRIVKLANSVTYDRCVSVIPFYRSSEGLARMEKALNHLEKVVLPVSILDLKLCANLTRFRESTNPLKKQHV